MAQLAEAALPSRFGGTFRAVSFRVSGEPGEILALVFGDPAEQDAPLVRLHSECLTGDALGSLRCDCGEQLQAALERIATSGGGVLLYLRQEGRGIGLSNKIRAYALQDVGLDTVDANTALGLPVDAREYATAAAILRRLGLEQVRLLTNNPAKRAALEQHGIRVVERVALAVPPNPVNLPYLRAKVERMGHLLELEDQPPTTDHQRPVSVRSVLGRPRVTVHYAQTLDGRIATRTGNSQWISGEASLQLAHRLRASHDVVMVGVGTVLADNPRLTVRHVAGPSPKRVILDSTLRLPLDAHVLADTTAPTLVATTGRAPRERLEAVRSRGADVLVFEEDESGRVDLCHLLECLRGRGVASVLLEGGSQAITSALRAELVDRLVVCIAPKVVGAGIEAVGDLDIRRLSEALTFTTARFTSLGDDAIFEGELTPEGPGRTAGLSA